MLHETQRMVDGPSPLVQWRKRAFDDIEEVLTL